jgi:hypothetical protein
LVILTPDTGHELLFSAARASAPSSFSGFIGFIVPVFLRFSEEAFA